VVCKMNKLRAIRSWLPNSVGTRNFFFSERSRPAVGPTQHLVQWVGVKRLWLETNQSPMLRLGKSGAITPPPLHTFMAQVRKTFIFSKVLRSSQIISRKLVQASTINNSFIFQEYSTF
jgi:hypothetical protein